MKKIFSAALLLLAAAGHLQAQTWSEWFRQNSTQKKYLLQQIAALKVYIDYGQRGYRIAKDGLTGIGNFAGSEFNLHSAYFDSRRIVNPRIKNYAKVAEIISLQTKLIRNCDRTNNDLSRTGGFNDGEMEYIRRSFNRLLENCEEILDELSAVTTDGDLGMSDDERMARIDQLYLEMQDNWDFCKTFANQARKMAVARMKEKSDIKTGRALRGHQNPQP